MLAVALVEPARGRLLFVGVGNVAGRLLGPDGQTALLSSPGIVGHQMRPPRTFEHPLPESGALVMHSDGLTERWRPSDISGLLHQDPLVGAVRLLRVAGTRRDDAGVVVADRLW